MKSELVNDIVNVSQQWAGTCLSADTISIIELRIDSRKSNPVPSIRGE
jgi:hypothetical protein